MIEMLDEVVQQAKQDRQVAKMLGKIAALDIRLMPTGRLVRIEHAIEQTQSPEWQQQTKKLSNLCDEVAQKVVGAGEDAEEMAMWISYNCQQVVRELVVQRAKQDRQVAKMLHKIAKLDAQRVKGDRRIAEVLGMVEALDAGLGLNRPAFLRERAIRNLENVIRRLQSRQQQQAMKLSTLCDEAARKIEGSGEDTEDMAMWISYNCQEVVRELDKK